MAAKDHGMTDEEYASLTDEERAGLEEELGEGDGEGNGGQDGNVEGGDGAGAGAGASVEGEGGDGRQGAGDDDPANAGRDDGAAEEGAPKIPDTVNVPLIKAEDVTQARERLTAIGTEKDELQQQFEDGDITAKEFRAGLDKLNAEASDLQWKINKSELAEEVSEQQKVRAWYADVGDYLGEHPELKASKLKLQAFDTIVREVTGDPANANLSNRQQLAKAHEIWARELGLPAPKARNEQGKQNDATQKAPAQERNFADRKVVPSLGKVPAAEVNETDDGRWAHLDRLMETNPIAYEEALAKMSEAEQEAYLASQ